METPPQPAGTKKYMHIFIYIYRQILIDIDVQIYYYIDMTSKDSLHRQVGVNQEL